MEVLVTGGAGYIGSHTIIELVAKGFRPVIVDSFINADKKVLKRLETILGQSVPCYQTDCKDEAGLQVVFDAHREIKAVIHFAALKAVNASISDPEEYYHNNINALTTLLKVMRANQVKQLIFSSSCTVYGDPDSIPVTEQSPIKEAENPYGHTKQVAENILQHVVKHTELRVALLRYFNPIGAHESGLIGEFCGGVPSNLVPYLTEAAAGIRKELTIFGKDYKTKDGTCVRDFIHVCDLASAHVAALEWLQKSALQIDAFNIGSGSGATVLELVKTFEKANEISLPYSFGERRAGDIPEIYADASKANNVLNWKANRSLEQALKDAWRWQKNIHNE